MVYGAARVCRGINLRGREAYAAVPNISMLFRLVYHLARSSAINFVKLKNKTYQELSSKAYTLKWLGNFIQEG